MQRPDRIDGAVVMVSLAGGALVAFGTGHGLPEWVFYSVLLIGASTVGRLLIEASISQRSATTLALSLQAVDLDSVAVQVLAQERAVLASDIASSLRGMLQRVLVLTAPGDGPPMEVRAVQVHRLAQKASAELRLQLEILRAEPAGTSAVDLSARTTRSTLPCTPDLVLGLFCVVLATVEAVAYQRSEDLSSGPLAVCLTMLVSGSVVARHVAPQVASWWVVALFLLGVALGNAVVPGLWLLPSTVVLVWFVIASRHRLTSRVLSALAVVTAASVSTWSSYPDNGPMTSGVLLLAFAGSLANRLTRFRAQEAQLRAKRHQAQITEVTTTVIAAERSAFARDIHDTVSHAVGLIALQAGAAQVLAPEDPGAARDALTIVETTARAALRELDEQGVPVTDRAAERWDVERLVARIRASGHDVVLTFENDLPAPLSPLVYRVTQEGLINVVRHAPGAPARVDIRSDDTGVTISVTNKASGQPSRGRHSGYGLIGLRERLAFAGGTLRAAPTKEGFELIAQLPPSVAADQDVKS